MLLCRPSGARFLRYGARKCTQAYAAWRIFGQALKKTSKGVLFPRRRKLAGHGRERGRGGELKVFWFFSSEKNTLA
jgi:hypothetical protein